MNARRVAKELEVQIRGINRNAPSIPPSGTPEERKQVSQFTITLTLGIHFFPNNSVIIRLFLTVPNYRSRWNYGKNILRGRKVTH